MIRKLAISAAIGAGLILAAPAAAMAGTNHGHHDTRSAAHTSERGHESRSARVRSSADRGLKHHHDCTTGKRCRPAPLPKPQGGWPCAKDHSCGTKHHYPICKPPTKPPGTGHHGHNGHHPKPKPPHHEPVPKPRGHHVHTVSSRVPQLAMTGFDATSPVSWGLGLLGGGILLLSVPTALTRRPKVVTEQIKSALQ